MSDNSLTDHAYDGIQEFDNPLPGWWKWMFVGSIVFSVLYAMVFSMGAPGRSMVDQYDAALAANTRLQFKEIGDLSADRATILAYMQKDEWLKVGQVVFKTNCISCHGREGEGNVGPNLTDDVYKNVRDVEGIARVIAQGANKGAMPAWANRLHPNEVVLVAAYVATMRGQNLPGRAPEGNPIPPWDDGSPESQNVPTDGAAADDAGTTEETETTEDGETEGGGA